VELAYYLQFYGCVIQGNFSICDGKTLAETSDVMIRSELEVHAHVCVCVCVCVFKDFPSLYMAVKYGH